MVDRGPVIEIVGRLIAEPDGLDRVGLDEGAGAELIDEGGEVFGGEVRFAINGEDAANEEDRTDRPAPIPSRPAPETEVEEDEDGDELENGGDMVVVPPVRIEEEAVEAVPVSHISHVIAEGKFRYVHAVQCHQPLSIELAPPD